MDERLATKLARKRKDTPNVLAAAGAPYNDGKRHIHVAPELPRSWCQNLIDHVQDHRHLRMGDATILLLIEHAQSTADKLATGRRVSIGKCKKASPKDKVLAALGLKAGSLLSFVITVSGDWYALIENARGTPAAQARMIALIDHELSHAGAKIAGKFVPRDILGGFVQDLGKDHVETCEGIEDDDGHVLVRFFHRTKGDRKLTWTIRKHDVEEFPPVLARHGVYTDNLARMVDVLEAAADTPLLRQAAE